VRTDDGAGVRDGDRAGGPRTSGKLDSAASCVLDLLDGTCRAEHGTHFDRSDAGGDGIRASAARLR